MKLSVITVTWNNVDLIAKQIESVRSGVHNVELEQIIIDNGSTDATVQLIQKKYPEVVLIANQDNAGFAAANNQGFARASGDYLLFLNPDMQVQPGSLDVIVQWLQDHPDVGIVSPKLIDETGQVNWDATPRRFPRLWEQIALLLKLPHIFPRLLDAYHMKNFQFEVEQPVDSVRGSFMLMRKDVAKTLGFAFDPRYFFWYEDVDLCREVKRLGLQVMYTPLITCVDYVGQSFKKRDTLWKQKNFTRSMLTYYQKWEPWYKTVWIAVLRPVAIGLAWLSDYFYKKRSTC